MPLDHTEIDRLATTYRATYTPDVEAGLSRLHDRLGLPVRNTSVRRLAIFRLSAAATVLILLAAGAFWLLQDPMVHLANTESETTSYPLPDGSVVTLQSGSELTYHPDLYNVDNRLVTLNGQGYFEIASDAVRPFIVQNDQSLLRVTGTAFNLRTDKSTMEVEVSEGAVELSLDGYKVVVAAHESALARAGEPLLPKPAPNLNHHAWRTGDLTFEHTPLSEALTYFYDNWGIECTWASGQPCDYPVSGSYTGGNAGAVLRDLATIGGLTVKAVGTDGKHYELSGSCGQ